MGEQSRWNCGSTQMSPEWEVVSTFNNLHIQYPATKTVEFGYSRINEVLRNPIRNFLKQSAKGRKTYKYK